MNKIIILLLSLLFSTFVWADENIKSMKNLALNYGSGGAENFISNLIEGEGDTEVSLELRENYKPDFSILAVREIEKTNNGNYFVQFSLFNTEKNNDERIGTNLGFGKRSLSDDKTLMTGFNVFFDYDNEGNARSSLGFEARSAALEFIFNQYFGIDDASNEKVLDGYDINLASQVPYMHWADIFINKYEWEGRDRDDIKGTKIGSELLLSPTFNLELAYDDKDKAGLEDEWYVNLIFVHPPRNESSLQDGFISKTAFSDKKDMTDQLLRKVKRQNKIMVEFNGSATISRLN